LAARVFTAAVVTTATTFTSGNVWGNSAGSIKLNPARSLTRISSSHASNAT
jgi:hypothetical protein